MLCSSVICVKLSFVLSGEVYTWGDNDEGQLGDGTTNAIQRPRLVAALQGKKINRVAVALHTPSPGRPASPPMLANSLLRYWIVSVLVRLL